MSTAIATRSRRKAATKQHDPFAHNPPVYCNEKGDGENTRDCRRVNPSGDCVTWVVGAHPTGAIAGYCDIHNARKTKRVRKKRAK